MVPCACAWQVGQVSPAMAVSHLKIQLYCQILGVPQYSDVGFNLDELPIDCCMQVTTSSAFPIDLATQICYGFAQCP